MQSYVNQFGCSSSSYSPMKILGLTGQKQSGKDTAADFIEQHVREWDVVRIGFADALKEEVCKACGIELAHLEANKDKYRTILQWWGTDFRRNMYGQDYWLKQWMARAVSSRAHLIIVPDVRFKNEAELLRQFGAKIFRVVRYGLPDDKHQSETEMASLEVDEVIPNNDSLENFCSIILSKFRKHYNGNNKPIQTTELTNLS